jgi:16S rRNA (uracil1498-N3)-methyltransferase
MTRRRWIADQVSGDRALLVGEHAAHLVRVLRARLGQEFEISTGESVHLGRISRIAEDRVEFTLGEEIPQTVQAPVILLLAIFKFDRMEWALEKATELGVTQVLPVVARRTEKHLAAAAGKRVARWRKIALQAAQQSRRAAPPEIAAPQPLKSALQTPAGLRIVLAEAERAVTLKQALSGNWKPETENSLALAVGPEGGWTEEELAHFSAAGWVPASLGHAILRAETAAIAALAVVMAEGAR